MDLVLFRVVFLETHAKKVNHLLFRAPTRPTRSSLLRKNILLGVSRRAIQDGDYIYTSGSVQNFENGKRLSRSLAHGKLRRLLTCRPSKNELVDFGLIRSKKE